NGVYEMNPNVPEHYRRLLRALKAEKCIPNRIVYNWHKEAKDLDNALENSIYRIFGLTKALVTELPKEKVKLLILNNYKENVQTLLYEALSGLVKTVNKEFSKYYFKAVELKTDYVYMNEILNYEFSATDGEEICYTDEGRFVRQITEYDIEKETRGMPSPFRNQGVYLITGGMGKLATLLAEYLAERYQARLILLGRSSLNESQKNEISRIESLGGEVMFIQADVSNQNEVNDAVKQARQVFNKIHGVFHCAGTIRDHLIKDKTYEELDAVIHSKVKGAVYLDEALKDEPLDFFTLFSSTSYLGNAGQADYAYANSFLNRFANYREELCGKEQRYGKTVSMSWPLWKDGGMTMREETIKLLRTINGCVPLPNEVGLKAIEQMLLQKHNHIILQYGETEKIRSQKNA
ncbi:MAG: SDR family NAD(P)-dependent oxidoreductase, partial [Acutalibacteraceae bacterium]|nr:SDR family NAD(P)-dependent oxidoreductase [Acutalibacteraceae bacterium]